MNRRSRSSPPLLPLYPAPELTPHIDALFSSRTTKPPVNVDDEHEGHDDSYQWCCYDEDREPEKPQRGLHFGLLSRAKFSRSLARHLCTQGTL